MEVCQAPPVQGQSMRGDMAVMLMQHGVVVAECTAAEVVWPAVASAVKQGVHQRQCSAAGIQRGAQQGMARGTARTVPGRCCCSTVHIVVIRGTYHAVAIAGTCWKVRRTLSNVNMQVGVVTYVDSMHVITSMCAIGRM